MSNEIKALQQLAEWYEHDDAHTEQYLREAITKMSDWLAGVAVRENIKDIIHSVNTILVVATPIIERGHYLGGRLEARRNLASHIADVTSNPFNA